MSADRHEFQLSCDWTDNSDGDGVIRFDWGAQIEFGIPVTSGGKEGRSNPEEMLVAAVASCYGITLALLFEKKRFPAFPIRIRATGEMLRQADKSLKFTSIVLRPTITIPEGDKAKNEVLLDLAHRAEKHCVISSALRGNVEITIEPVVEIAKAPG